MAKFKRVQELTDPDSGLKIKQSITSINGNITVQYGEVFVVGSKEYPQPGQNKSSDFSFQIGSIEDLEKAIADNPLIAPHLTIILEKMATPYKGSKPAA